MEIKDGLKILFELRKGEFLREKNNIIICFILDAVDNM